MAQIVDYKVGKWMIWGSGILMAGFLTVSTGCGQASKSIGDIPQASASSSVTNASPSDVDLLKAANGKLNLNTTNSGTTQTTSKSSSVMVSGGGTISIVFSHPRLNAHMAGIGAIEYPYTDTISYDWSNSPYEPTAWNNTQTEYRLAPGSRFQVSTPKAGEACQSCYYKAYSKTVDNSTTMIVDEQGPTVGVSFALEATGMFDVNIHFFEQRFQGYVFSLKEGGKYAVNKTANGTQVVTGFGPFSLVKSGQTYTLVSKLMFPVDTSTVNELAFRVFNSQGQEIGEAVSPLDKPVFSFKVYQNGVLKPVTSL